MRRLFARIVRFLRSRRLAIGLIAFLAVYGVVGTLVPRGGPGDPGVKTWAAAHPIAEAVASPLGLHGAYVSPIFIVLAVLIAASTSACAVERTRRAHAAWRATSRLSQASMDRLRNRPQGTFRISSGAAPEGSVAAVVEGLSHVGLKVRLEGTAVDARAGEVGLLGSPLFHWSIVALMLVAAMGQAMRSEGFMALPVGERVAEVHSEYLQVTEGPLFRERHTGIELKAVEIDRDYSSNGVAYGAVPTVIAYRDGVEIASGRVHPNNPLRVGSLMIHMSELGPAATIALESTGGAEVGRDTITFDLSDETSSGTKPKGFTLAATADAAPVKVRMQVLVYDASTPGAAGRTSRVVVQTATVDAQSYGPPIVVAETEALDLPGGQRLRIADVGDWARVSVTNDWSVPYIYALLIASILGLALAVLVPTRRASVLLVEDEAGHALHLGMWHARGDSLFKRRVVEIVRAAATGEAEEEDG